MTQPSSSEGAKFRARVFSLTIHETSRTYLHSNDDIAKSSLAHVAEGALANDRAKLESRERQILRNGGRGRVDVQAEAGVRLEAREVLAVELWSLDLNCVGRQLRVWSATHREPIDGSR